MKLLPIILLLLLPACVSSREEMDESNYSMPEKNIVNFQKVNDDLFRSGRLYPADIKAIKKQYDIQTIISLEMLAPSNKRMQEERQTARELGISFINIPMFPIGDLDKTKLWQAYIAFRTADKPVLVHCWRGSERTGMVVGMHRVILDGRSYDRTFEEMNLYGFSWLFNGWKRDFKRAIEHGEQ